ncbi:MAG: hypothetical protein K2W80_00230, partial [Burkholderiales bacterium]|nr:hypothetical protein [Burkholderiales bacterium]
PDQQPGFQVARRTASTGSMEFLSCRPADNIRPALRVVCSLENTGPVFAEILPFSLAAKELPR